MGLRGWPELSPFAVMWRRRWGCGFLLLLALLLLLPSGQPPQQAEPASARSTARQQQEERESRQGGHLPPQHSPLQLIPLDSFSADQFIVVTQRAARPRRRAYRLLRAAKRSQEAGESTRLLLLDPPPPADRRQLERQGLQTRGFNETVSESISLHRRLPEVRHPLCLQQEYSQNLPTASIIICFHNEAWSTLLRTVNSVIDTAPKKFLKEIILVDDLSNQGHLKASLSEYVSKLDGVKLIRSNKRLGAIGGRLLGAARATGDVLIFMDSHCECHNGWLEPLLDRIAHDRTRVVSPVIDGIDWKTFQYYHSVDPQRGVFNWKLDFHWEPIPEYEQKWRTSPTIPVQSPAVSGGVLAMNRHYFQNVGAYDPGMLMWGTENVELSLRVWLCGGSVEVLPCSRVGHVYRKNAPYSPPYEEIVVKNKVRVAEVWLDSFKKIFYKQDMPSFLLSKIAVPDCMERLQLRKRLSCKHFHWFLTNIYPELYLPEDKSGYFGAARQRFLLYNVGTGYCASYETKWSTSGYPVTLTQCSGHGNQSGEIIHVFTGKCIEAIKNGPSKDLFLRPCNKYTTQQLWRLEKVIITNKG